MRVGFQALAFDRWSIQLKLKWTSIFRKFSDLIEWEAKCMCGFNDTKYDYNLLIASIEQKNNILVINYFDNSRKGFKVLNSYFSIENTPLSKCSLLQKGPDWDIALSLWSSLEYNTSTCIVGFPSACFLWASNPIKTEMEIFQIFVWKMIFILI